MSRNAINVPLNPLEDEELEIPMYEDGGQLKSNVPGLLGTITKTGYSVFFQRVFEVHGRTNDSRVDNATLLVIKISPRVKDDGRQFKKFSITLELEPAPGALGAQRNAKPPAILSYEPAQEGAWFIKERMVNRSESGEVAANVGGQVPGGVTLGFSAKKGVTEDSEHRILHTVKAEPDYSERAHEHPDKVTWRLSPADNADGIGDYMAVAMLIERGRGSQFVIKADSKASLGFVSNVANAIPGRTETYLGPFGPTPTDGRIQKMPSGVSADALQEASDKLLQTFAFIHIPEKVLARSFYNNTETNPPALAPAPASGPSQSGVSPNQLLPVPPIQAKPIAEVPQTPLVSNSSSLPVEETAAHREPSPLPQRGHGGAPLVSNSSNPISNEVLLGVDVDMQLGRGKSLALRNCRADRHRKMAALYQRLAQLHREEAEEAELWYEQRYADEAEMDT